MPGEVLQGKGRFVLLFGSLVGDSGSESSQVGQLLPEGGNLRAAEESYLLQMSEEGFDILFRENARKSKEEFQRFLLDNLPGLKLKYSPYYISSRVYPVFERTVLKKG
jgi:hypothetical protein